MAVPSSVMPSASQGGTRPPCSGRSAVQERFITRIDTSTLCSLFIRHRSNASGPTSQGGHHEEIRRGKGTFVDGAQTYQFSYYQFSILISDFLGYTPDHGSHPDRLSSWLCHLWPCSAVRSRPSQRPCPRPEEQRRQEM